MRDEIFDRDYQFGRDALNHGIDRLVKRTMRSFSLLTAIQFEAPWLQSAKAEHGRSQLI